MRKRFEQDNKQRTQQSKAAIPLDEELLAAMQQGLPECSGVAVGLDRLLMLAMNKQSIAQVQSFSSK